MSAHDGGDEWRDDVVFDDDFVNDAPVQEGGPLPKPSRESLREVKREAKERRKAARRPAKPAKPPKASRASSTASSNRSRNTLSVILTLAVVGAGAYFLYTDQQPTSSSVADDPGVADPVDAEVAAEQREQDRNVDPWEGTGASDWPRGASGIEPGKARALGPYSAADVQESLTNSEAYLETAILDERVVYKGSVDPLLATLEEPDFLREQYGDPATGRSWSYLATRFRPNVVGPVGEVIRVKGDMRPVLHGETLAVNFSFAIAYAVRSLKERDEAPQLIVVRREGELRFPYDGPGAIGLPYPGDMRYISDHSVCGRKWPFPAYTETWMDQSRKPGDEDVTGNQSHDLTDPKDSLKDIKGCFTNTGSL